jgi:FAD binding domain
LGSNTCVQEGHNLAWKIAFVEKGIAGRGLLDSYNEERREIGAQLVRESNCGLGRHAAVWAALGMFEGSPEKGSKALKELAEASVAGVTRRAQLHASIEAVRHETESLGITRNQVYISKAVYLDDESPAQKFEGNPIMDIFITSRPGHRLPHAWLSGMVPGKQISTIDLAGNCAFTVFTGHGGDAWKEAAANVTKVLGVPINCYSIGWGLDYHDLYRDWFKKREIEEDGILLVRPDRYVAWRSTKMISDAGEKLLHVFRRILSRE